MDIKGVTILDYMINQIKMQPLVEDIVLAISDQEENNMYKAIAKKHGIKYVTGSDKDVLKRLITGAELVGADNILRVTTESPYTYYDLFDQVYKHHCENGIEYSVISGVPDGAFFEFFTIDSLRKSWNRGSDKHRSELCSLYIFENQNEFKIAKHLPAEGLARLDMRLTVDWPEDLIVLREIYKGLNLDSKKQLEFKRVIEFLDNNPKINTINNWIDSGIGRVWY